jgi:U3 small nucleolar RNA-associated protein 20
MGEERFGKHMKQIIANISYEYKDGRMSAINLFYAVIEKLPEELLGKHTQLFFIPLVLQMVNDESNKCRDAVIKCLERLLSRSSTEMLQATHGYIVKWSKQHGPLRVASLQVLGIFADVRSDFIQQSNLLLDWLQSLQTNLNEKSSEWEISYFSLLCVEKFSKNFEVDLSKADDLWKGIVECLVDTHPWVRLASCRVLHKIFVASGLHKILHASPGMLFEIVRNLCFQMNAGEEEFSQELSEFCIKTLTLVLPIMNESPHLCFAKDQEQDGRNPVPWLVQRLSQIAKAKGSKRRIAVFKCFAAFTTQHTEIVSPHLALMLEPLHRSSVEARNELENPYLSQKREVGSEEVISESNLATEVLQVIEETATSSESFLKALGSVKNKARDKKEQRKLEIKLEAANDPQAAAERKIKKQVRERQRKKRRVQDRRHDRGAVKKRRSVF